MPEKVKPAKQDKLERVYVKPEQPARPVKSDESKPTGLRPPLSSHHWVKVGQLDETVEP